MTTLPNLDYEYSDLEPFIDAKTMEIHHSKHHQAYISKYDAAIDGTTLAQKPLHEVLSDLNNVSDDILGAVRNNGGGHSNHSLFWKVIGPNCGGEPTNEFGSLITQTFGSFDAFKDQFANAAATRFGSGWAWLSVEPGGKLVIESTANQDSPIMHGHTPLFGLDVWEHAYYLHYQNRRPDYVKAAFDIIDWDTVGKRFA